MSEARHYFIQTSPGLPWTQEKNGISYCSYITNTKAQTKYREIYKRTRIENNGQLSLGEISSYRYDCLTTNDFIIEEDQVFEVYNKRAHIENAIKELKEDYQLGKIVMDSFDANDVITQITMFTYTLVQLIKNEGLPPKRCHG
ncbi:MAG: transposase [Bdellovibrionaceae bacterium]|nr:transposase [Pseudobdellovibrionaceae bacterium]